MPVKSTRFRQLVTRRRRKGPYVREIIVETTTQRFCRRHNEACVPARPQNPVSLSNTSIWLLKMLEEPARKQTIDRRIS